MIKEVKFHCPPIFNQNADTRFGHNLGKERVLILTSKKNIDDLPDTYPLDEESGFHLDIDYLRTYWRCETRHIKKRLYSHEFTPMDVGEFIDSLSD